MKSHNEILEEAYAKAEQIVSSPNDSAPLVDAAMCRDVDLIIERAEANKGLLAVLVTLFTHKVNSPEQDIRYHQAQLPGGFAGRGIDSAFVTPFLKMHGFPAMADSGWLTRSLEQAHPYTLDYPGKIKPDAMKAAFLQIVDAIEGKHTSPFDLLVYIFTGLVRSRELSHVDLAKPHKLTISAIIPLLERHFTRHYSCAGAARLPVLAIYAVYQCLMDFGRYRGKTLCALESHTSADRRSGRIGDVDVNMADGTPFEGVEVKHEIPITRKLVAEAYEKFKPYHTERYYLLTTANMDSADWEAIESETSRIQQIHGCQVIVNGVYSTLRYYLRLLPDPAEFIDKYVELIKSDPAVKYQHRAAWNECVSRT